MREFWRKILFFAIKKLKSSRSFCHATRRRFLPKSRAGNPPRPALSKADLQFAGYRFAWTKGFVSRFYQSTCAKEFDVPLISPAEAAEILAEISENHRFTLYEHFLTDKIGHDQDFARARIHLPLLAEFIRACLQRIDLKKTTFILTSDHGNIEDLSVRNHTLNDVPTIVWGRKRDEISKQIKELTDITPAILQLLTK